MGLTSLSKSNFLTVSGRLRIRPNFGKIIVTTNSPVTLVCEYEGRDMLPVTWFKEPIHREHFGFMTRRWTVRKTGVLVTIEIQKQFAVPEDSAEYMCVAGPYSKAVQVQVVDGMSVQIN